MPLQRDIGFFGSLEASWRPVPENAWFTGGMEARIQGSLWSLRLDVLISPNRWAALAHVQETSTPGVLPLVS